MNSLLLASKSPRRQELLAQLGLAFECVEGGVDESSLQGESARNYVDRMARAKAYAGWLNVEAGMQAIPVLGADTCVILDGEIFGKPIDRTHAIEMLSQLSGRSHFVLTAVAVCLQGELQSICCEAKVYFADLTPQQIANYVDTKEPMDKAGAYGIQGLGGQFVIKIEGSYSCVVGLPLYETMGLLDTYGVPK